MSAAESPDVVPVEIQRLEMLIASIVDVTKQRERVALEDCFGRVVIRLTEASGLTIYHLQPKDGDLLAVPVLQLAEGVDVVTGSAKNEPFFLSSNAALAACLGKPYAAANPSEAGKIEKVLILPLRGPQGDVSAFCQIENARNDGNTQRVLPLLLEFYTNFLSLLDDNERDTLTGLLNRKTLDMRISRILTTLRNQDKRAVDKAATVKFCLAALDIDHFKNINDTVGHVYGDEVLLLFSNLMRKTFRENDLLFRFGGEEFVVVLANADTAQARIALERFRGAVEKNQFPQVGQVTVSIGVAAISSGEMARTTIERADQALYFSKHHGRNQIRVYEDLVKQGLLAKQNIQAGEIELF